MIAVVIGELPEVGQDTQFCLNPQRLFTNSI